MRAVAAGLIYFLLVFAVGWVLGPIRGLREVPHLGRTTASLLEAPLMLMAMIVSARWVLRRLDVPYVLNTPVAIGLVALGILLGAEFTVDGGRAVCRSKHLASYLSAHGLISLLLFLLFAAMPTLVERLRPGASPV